MDLGVNLLNPVQDSANDLDHLRRITHGRMALQGGVSSAAVMEGPPERIAAKCAGACASWASTAGMFASLTRACRTLLPICKPAGGGRNLRPVSAGIGWYNRTIFLPTSPSRLPLNPSTLLPLAFNGKYQHNRND